MAVATVSSFDVFDKNTPVPWTLGAGLFEEIVEAWHDTRTVMTVSKRAATQDVAHFLNDRSPEEETTTFPVLKAIVLDDDPAPPLDLTHEEESTPWPEQGAAYREYQPALAFSGKPRSATHRSDGRVRIATTHRPVPEDLHTQMQETRTSQATMTLERPHRYYPDWNTSEQEVEELRRLFELEDRTPIRKRVHRALSRAVPKRMRLYFKTLKQEIWHKPVWR